MASFLEAARLQTGIEGFIRNNVIYAELSPQGMMTSLSPGSVIEIAVDPLDCLVCNAELYSEVSAAYLKYKMYHGALEDVQNFAKLYWENAIPLTQFDIKSMSKYEEGVFEVLIKASIPKEHIRKHIEKA